MARNRYRRLAHNHDFTVLWTGETVSELGSSMSLFVFPLVAYALTGSPIGASVVSAAYTVGQIVLALPAGALVDRWDRRRVMLAASAAGAVLYASLAIAQLTGTLTVAQLAIVALLTGIAGSFFRPAEMAAIRKVVPTGDLPTALSQNQARQHVASLAGGPTGGALYSLARWIPFAVDAVSYLGSCLAIGRIRTSLAAPRRDESHRALLTEIREGLTYNWSQPFLRAILWYAGLVNAAANAFFLVVVLRMVQAGVHPAAIGATETAAGVAGIIGALASPAMIDRLPTGRLAIYSAWALALGCAPMAMTVDPVMIGLLIMVAIFFNPVTNAAIGSYRIAITPDHLQGRAQTAMNFVAMVASPLGPLAGGTLMARLGGATAMLVVVAAFAGGALLLTVSKSVRAIPRPDQWPVANLDAPAG